MLKWSALDEALARPSAAFGLDQGQGRSIGLPDILFQRAAV